MQQAWRAFEEQHMNWEQELTPDRLYVQQVITWGPSLLLMYDWMRQFYISLELGGTVVGAIDTLFLMHLNDHAMTALEWIEENLDPSRVR